MSKQPMIADHCEAVSTQNGTTKAQYNAGIQLVREAMRSLERVDAQEIAATCHPKYYWWHRLKLKNAPRVSYRAIVEIAHGVVTIHAVLPRDNDTYDTVRALWKKHRTPLPTDDDGDE